MGDFEDRVFENTESENEELIEAIKFWKRFIDDVFMLFKGNEELCDQLVDWLNSIMPSIKLKANYSNDCLEFLDLKIMIRNGKLETELYTKPTNLQLYLDFTSNRPSHCKRGLVYGQALRIVERCSRAESVGPHLEILKEKLVERNYPAELIDSQFSKAKKKDRKKLIFQERKKKNNDKKVRLIFTHNEGNPPLHKWIRESKQFLETPKAKKIGQEMQVVFKQPKNIKQLVAGNKNNKNRQSEKIQDAGCFKCRKGCKVSCRVMKETKYFCSTNTQKTYQIMQRLDCDSSFLIYLATCLRCGGQYVGKSTTSFKKRHSNHKKEIETGRGGLGNHFGGERACSYQDIQFILIEGVKEGDKKLLERREKFWQYQLRAFRENGGNAMSIR